MAEYSNNAIQTVATHQPVIFAESPVPCTRGLVRHRDGTGNFTLKGYVPGRRCACRDRMAPYVVDFSANIAVPTDTDPGAISLALTLDGSIIPASTMTVTPAAANEYFNVSCAVIADVWNGCCESLTVENVGAIPVLVQNANIIFSRPDLAISR